MKLQLIITKTISDLFHVQMSGHRPNPNFREYITGWTKTYGEAHRFALAICNTLELLGNEVTVFNDKSIKNDGDSYCDFMAFEKLPVAD